MSERVPRGRCQNIYTPFGVFNAIQGQQLFDELRWFVKEIGEVTNLAYRTLRHFSILTRWNVKIFLEFTYHHFEIT